MEFQTIAKLLEENRQKEAQNAEERAIARYQQLTIMKEILEIEMETVENILGIKK